MKTTTNNNNSGECKCLGWCGKTFWSPNKTTIRFCSKCRQKRNNASESMSRLEMSAMCRTVDREHQSLVTSDD